MNSPASGEDRLAAWRRGFRGQSPNILAMLPLAAVDYRLNSRARSKPTAGARDEQGTVDDGT
jgi:hypothetical protein